MYYPEPALTLFKPFTVHPALKTFSASLRLKSYLSFQDQLKLLAFQKPSGPSPFLSISATSLSPHSLHSRHTSTLAGPFTPQAFFPPLCLAPRMSGFFTREVPLVFFLSFFFFNIRMCTLRPEILISFSSLSQWVWLIIVSICWVNGGTHRLAVC